MPLWSPGETGLSQKGRTQWTGLWPGSLALSQRRCADPSPMGRIIRGLWLEQDALCSLPARACCPLYHGAFAWHLAPPPPAKKPQLLEETLPGPGREASASRGSLLREKQASALQAHPASRGSFQSTNHWQERTVNPWPRLTKGFPAPRSPSRAGLNGANGPLMAHCRSWSVILHWRFI